MRMRCAYLCAGALLCLSPSAASAQGRGQRGGLSDKEVARDLAERGFELYEQGESEKAIVSFRMAERRVHSPVHQLYIARAEAKLGRFLEALEAYESIVAESFAPGSPKPFIEAQGNARTELEALKVRTPSLKILVDGVPKGEVRVTIDGALMKPGTLGEPHRLNPGKHTVVASAPNVSAVEKTLTLAEGSYVQTLEISLQPGGVSIPAVVSFSIGGIGLVAGTATGVAYLGKPEANPTLGILSLAGFVTGGIGLVTGTLLVALSGTSEASSATSSASKRTASPRIQAGIGPGLLIVRGVF